MESENKYGLSAFEINQVISIIKKNLKVDSIILFGSRAKGNFENGSDVDLSLTGNELKLNDILDASNEIDNLLLPYKFDLILHNRIKEKALLEHIDRIGIKLYDRNAEDPMT